MIKDWDEIFLSGADSNADFMVKASYEYYFIDTLIGMATSYETDLGISMVSLLLILLLTQFVAFLFTITLQPFSFIGIIIAKTSS